MKATQRKFNESVKSLYNSILIYLKYMDEISNFMAKCKLQKSAQNKILI